MRAAKRPWSGWFITFEGVDGAGKTTQLRTLGVLLRQRGHRVFETHEPGGTEVGERIRDLLLDPDGEILPRTELLLMVASRAQHVEQAIRPALERGEIVLCDRFADATLAYQGGGRGFPVSFLQSVNEFATQGIKPDLTFLLDLDPRIGRTRLTGRGPRSRLDDESQTFHNAVRQAYLELAKRERDRFVVIDAARSMNIVQQKIRTEMTRRGIL